MVRKLFNIPGQESEEHWVSISDVMTGLMVIFLFIAISYMVNAQKTTNEVRKHLGAYRELQANLYKELQAEFEGTPAKQQQFQVRWQGHLDIATLSIRFKKPFIQGDATVPSEFKTVLLNFFPRYVAILTKPEYRNDIAEIRIEGHTSSEWHDRIGVDRAYYNNMKLSQDRARNVLEYVLEMRHRQVTENKEWIKKYLTANGLSSSKLIFDSDRNQNQEESRRVEFRVVTKSEKLIDEIRQLIEAFDK